MSKSRVKNQSVARTSASVTAEQLAQLGRVFPEAVADGKVDFDKLRATLGDTVETRQERFSFGWAGKQDSITLLQTPSRATLVPCPEESVNFDKTQHLFIEGDNLEVLKLLFKPYFGRVKLIYIDPPYNTGQDFIYPDDYADPLATYLKLTGQVDQEGNLLTSNPETSGRYHSSWLSMMYPRLFLARQLLREDGVICVSIDDHEVHHLRMVMNEVFGEENFLASFVRRRRMATGMRDDPVSPDHEYVLAYARSLENVRLFGKARDEKDYPLQDKEGKYRSTDLTIGMTKLMRPNQYYAIHHPRTGNAHWPPENRVWRFEPTTMKGHIRDGNIIWPDDQETGQMLRPRFKTRFTPGDTKPVPVSTWMDTKRTGEDCENSAETLLAGLNQEATKEIKELFGDQVLEYPKPVSLLRSLLALSTELNDVVMDFFAGSCTTAQAALELNREDGSRRQFIMVQLPEPTVKHISSKQASKQASNSYATIADIGKERIRRVIAKLKKDNNGKLDLKSGEAPEDLGFKVFKLAASNYVPWTGTADRDPDKYIEQLTLFTDPLVAGWTPVNVIWEVAIKEGYGLNARIEQVKGCKENIVYQVTDQDKQQSFRICLDEQLATDVARALGLGRDDLFICRDKALDDTLAANLALQCRLKVI